MWNVGVGVGCDQAAAVSVPDDDCVLQDLKLQDAHATSWVNRAKQVREGGRLFGLERVNVWSVFVGRVRLEGTQCMRGCGMDGGA